MLFNGRAPTPGVQVAVLGTARGRVSVAAERREPGLVPATPTRENQSEGYATPPDRQHPAFPS